MPAVFQEQSWHCANVKPASTNAPADLLTRYPRKAGANLLNSVPKIPSSFLAPLSFPQPWASPKKSSSLLEKRERDHVSHGAVASGGWMQVVAGIELGG